MGFVVKAVKSVFKAVKGVVSAVVGGVIGFLIGKKSKAEAQAVNNLNKSLEPEAFRKIVLGKVASGLDVRFWQVWGTDGKNFDEVIALAGHQINAVKELYLEKDLAISDTGVVQTKFSGILSRAVKLGARNQTALSVGDGTQWTASATFDHTAHMKLAWVPDDKKMPNGIPSRYTQVVEGALVYDPRRDSTVVGGSGTHRINDRTTWQYSPLDGNGVPIGRNNALQTLWYLLGWKVPVKDANGNLTGEEELICGRGVEPEDINLASFIAGANACELAAYYTDVVLSTENDHTENENKITCNGLIGRLIDPGGLWSYYANVDDTANIAVELTDDDIVDGSDISWNEYDSMQSQYNQVTGKFVNPSPITLFQAFPYPMVTDANYVANLGIKRRKTQDFQQVLDNVLAQRLARLFLNEGQYQGEFDANFNYRALNAQAWSVVRYTSERFGFVKLFRVWRHEIATLTGVGMTLKEIHPSIWSAGSTANALPTGAGQGGDAAAQIVLTGLLANDLVIVGPGANPTRLSAMRVIWDEPSVKVKQTEVRYRLVGTTYWETVSPVIRGTNNFKVVSPLLPGGTYEVQARHISVNNIEGSWVTLAPNFVANNAGNLTYEGIVSAAGSAIWSNVTGTGRPQDYADVTANNQAATIANQGPGATAIGSDVLNYSTDGNNCIVARPLGGSFRSDLPNVSGAIKIVIPGGFSNLMMKFTVDIYDYSNDRSCQYIIGGYPYSVSSFWISTTAQFIGREIDSKTVRFGFDGTNICVWIGEPNSNWSYPTVLVKDFIGRGGNPNTFKENWNISLDTNAAQNVTRTIIKPRSSDAVYGENVFEVTNGAVATLPNFRTNLGQAAAIANQGVFATRNSVAYGESLLTGFGSLAPLNNVRLGTTGQVLREDNSTKITDALAITSLGQAATIANQGFFATQSYADWSTRVSNKPGELTDGRILAGLTNTGDIARDIPLTRANSSNLLRYNAGGLFTGELAADVTGNHQAATIAGQGAFATISTAAYGSAYLTGFGTLAADSLVKIGSSGKAYREDGTTKLTDNLVVTNLGQAATIANQGPGATATANDVLNYKQENSTTFIPHPQGASGNLASANNVVGAIRIDLPVLWTNTMLRFTVEIFDYQSHASTTYLVGGYNYTGTGSGGFWVNPFAQMIGRATKAKSVKFGSYNGKACIWIGEPTDTWNYPTVRVTNFFGRGSVYSSIATGWNIALDTVAAANNDGLGNAINIANPSASDAVFGVNSYEGIGGALATLNNFKTSLGQASTIVNQGSFATLNSAAYGSAYLTGFGTLAADSLVKLGGSGKVYREDGTTRLTDALAVTSLGQAATIVGQSVWATASTTRTPSQVDSRVAKIADTGRVSDPTMYNTQAIVGPRNTTNLSPTYTVGGSNVTVSLPAHTRKIAGPSGPQTLSYGAMSATWPFSSYWAAYIDDINLTGIASPTVVLTANPDDLLYPGRYHIASGVTPASNGTGGGTGTGGGGGSGFEDCVAHCMYMPDGRQAFEYEIGDNLKIIDETNWNKATYTNVTAIKIAVAPCVELISASGISVIVSETTPCTLKFGPCIYAKNIEGHLLAVEDENGFRWEKIISVKKVGILPVAHISANESTYAAGSKPGKFIYTHNVIQKP